MQPSIKKNTIPTKYLMKNTYGLYKRNTIILIQILL
jgi:hypothetical protein